MVIYLYIIGVEVPVEPLQGKYRGIADTPTNSKMENLTVTKLSILDISVILATPLLNYQQKT